ncbi:TPA: CYTH domain-containing protein [Candidatus Poribacteria bacterium]|jgi:predicted adenylyl cyclase CyaB|nr:CYTH domain-containing protein [Candidatus Poribacteria bacterium]HIA67298.1 CYTH domain-containing protein [Candidatus Poribacteria bacterium]HIB91716.1 CYTH domain-containing protein [Candidatus Poribacteria bacterium]HIC01491.1 CYTH domain-containing protein [Candidatus Poribacteria bacterium]HIC17176.1 CYTH domain-containing protein [Candidatus Poribacteria bacterium]
MKNLEVKAKCISPELAIQNLVGLGATHEKKMCQVDTYFNAPEGRLKLREEGSDFASLIYYHRCDTAESCYSDYHICQIHDLDSFKLILSSALGTKVIVEKTRDLWWFGNTRVHLDHVSGLGDFIELETVLRNQTETSAWLEHNHVKDTLKIVEEDLVPVSYSDLLV